VSTTVLPSLTTLNRHWRKRVHSPTMKSTIEHTIKSTIEPSIKLPTAPIAGKIKSTQKSHTISMLRIWHWQLAHMNPSTMQSLNDGYTHNDSMCTVCIQAKHTQWFIKVPVKHTIKLFELEQLDMCSLFSTPTFGDIQYYILSINGYTRFISVWQFPNKTAETCTSAYQSFTARLDLIGYEIKQFRCDNAWGEYDNQTVLHIFVTQGTPYKPWPPYTNY